MKRKQNKTILITGGAGFIGSNFVRHIYKTYPHYKVYNLDALTYAGNLDNLKDISDAEAQKALARQRYFFVKGDIGDASLVENLFRQHHFDYVVHFAAESHVDRSIMSDELFMRTNLLGTHNLIGVAKKYRTPRFIHISTDEVYGDVGEGVSVETSPIRPSNPYSASKAAADLLVQSYIRTHKAPMLIVRGSNNFGPYQYPEKLIPLTITNLIEGKKIPVHGDGQQIRKWIHVNDFCSGIDLVMHRAEDGGIYNISGLEMSNIDVIKNISAILNKNHEHHIEFIKDRPGGDKRYAVDASKIKSELGWKLKFPIDKSLRTVVQWYLDNQEWWKKVRKKKDFKVYYQKNLKSEY